MAANIEPVSGALANVGKLAEELDGGFVTAEVLESAFGGITLVEERFVEGA